MLANVDDKYSHRNWQIYIMRTTYTYFLGSKGCKLVRITDYPFWVCEKNKKKIFLQLLKNVYAVHSNKSVAIRIDNPNCPF